MHELIQSILEENFKRNRKRFESHKLLEEVELKLGGYKYDLNGGYKAFASVIEALVRDGRLKAVESSGKIGMTPALYGKYTILGDDTTVLSEKYKGEILSLHPDLSQEYYLKHIKQYEEDRVYVLRTNQFLQQRGIQYFQNFRCTWNERSFEIFNDEKLLGLHGQTILKRLGVGLECLNCYKTHEAFFYVHLTRKDTGNVLIIENKDTFVSLITSINSHENRIQNLNDIQLLIYGEGKKIISSFAFMKEISRDFKVGKVYYFGDVDFTGLDICISLARNFQEYNIIPHTGLYEQLLDRVMMPPQARNNDRFDVKTFLHYFDPKSAERIRAIIEEGRYIPQEGLCFADGKIEI